MNAIRFLFRKPPEADPSDLAARRVTNKDPLEWVKRSQEAGQVDGQHYTAYIEDIGELRLQGKYGEAIALLLRLVDAVEAQNAIDDAGVPGWYYEQLSIIYRRQEDYAAEISILERFIKQKPALNIEQDKLSERLEKVRSLLDKI